MKLPDHETHMGEVERLAEEQRLGAARPTPVELPKGETANYVNPGVVAPIFMGKDHETIPERYVIHFSVTTCKNCNTTETSSDFFALSYIRSRIGGTRIRHLVKSNGPLYNLPVDRIRTGTHTTPFCSACPSIDLSHLPPPPEPSQLRDLPEPTLKGRKPNPSGERPVKEKKEPKKPTTLDDLI